MRIISSLVNPISTVVVILTKYYILKLLFLMYYRKILCCCFLLVNDVIATCRNCPFVCYLTITREKYES